MAQSKSNLRRWDLFTLWIQPSLRQDNADLLLNKFVLFCRIEIIVVNNGHAVLSAVVIEDAALVSGEGNSCAPGF